MESGSDVVNDFSVEEFKGAPKKKKNLSWADQSCIPLIIWSCLAIGRVIDSLVLDAFNCLEVCN